MLLPVILFVVRLAITIFCLVSLICSGFQDSNGETKWFIYLTNWSFTLLTITLGLLTSLSLYYMCYEERYRFPDEAMTYGSTGQALDTARMWKADEVIDVTVVRTKPVVSKLTRSRWPHQVSWLFYNISFAAGIEVTILYWTAVQDGSVGFLDVSAHALNSVIILVEICLGRVPIRLLHSVYTMIYVFLYFIFSIIYWKAGGLNADNENYI